ncbi:MAG: NAD(P)H-hydrate dehydratase [Bacteroidia bacterium]|nr:NAD(P)H-hydrate dehydratase [Bacteroidia bacterium]
MKIFRSDQIKNIDNYTILHEPVASIELMERAAGRLFSWYISRFERNRKIFVFAGPGNNGGDGLALARMLAHDRYDVVLQYVKFTEKNSSDWDLNFQRLKRDSRIDINIITSPARFPIISDDDVIIDAIFGSGLTRPVEGLPKEIIGMINNTEADHTLSFQFPKLAFLLAENAKFVGAWEVLPIGLSKDAILKNSSPYNFTGPEDITPLLKIRSKFDHKGIFGHGLLVAGSIGKMGAAILSAGAALRSGIGLITCHLPSSGRIIMQTAVPEAMVQSDSSEEIIGSIDVSTSFDAAAVGPGLGMDALTEKALHLFLKEFKKPLVIDADAINLLAGNKKWYSLLNPEVILTPHPKEFERLAGKSNNGFARLQKQIEFSVKNKCIVVLKGAYTSISTPGGNVFFNSTGNPGMATAGSGDVLTGIILSLLAQGYSAENAALTGVYLHGLAGDIAAGKSGYESLIASDIINNIGDAYYKIRQKSV